MVMSSDTTGLLLKHRLRTETVKILYGKTPPLLFISPLVGAVMAAVLWNVVDHGRLVLWVALLTTVTTFRLVLVLLFRGRKPSLDLRSWDRAYAALYLALCLAWGVGAVWVMPASMAYETVVFAILMGMAAGAAVIYGIHRLAIWSMAAIMLPGTIDFALRGDTEHRVMALAGLIYIAVMYNASRELAHYFRESQQLALELAIARDRAEHLARIDALTGLCNRRAFYEQGETLLRQARRYGKPLSLIMLDIDHFKSVNDSRGHAAGDATLQAVALAIQETPRETDVAGRVGGEEFALLLPETSLADASRLAERLRSRIADKLSVSHDGGEIRITASFGVAEFDSTTESLDVLVARADALLYRAKESGRNRVVATGA
jgi:diguanylate cyclase (GGDEF)-like protein